MKHHFGDFLYREGDYWTSIPNVERFAFMAEFQIANKDEVVVLTISKDHEHWRQVFDCPNIEEIILHDPSKEQAEEIYKVKKLKRLRVTFFRPKDIEFIGRAENVEELILEYVAGFEDLSPLRKLKNLKSLHFENLRRVSDFSGLEGINSLKYLHISGTFDWHQPVENFNFLKELPNLEILELKYSVKNKSEFPVFKSLINHKKIRKVIISSNIFQTQDYAFLSQALPNVIGIENQSYKKIAYNHLKLRKDDFRFNLSDEELKKNHPEVLIRYDGTREIADPEEEWFEFIGKGAGKVKCKSPKAEQKIEEFNQKYEEMKAKSREYLKSLL